jgi:endonuclease YncB( thermonuclease family)
MKNHRRPLAALMIWAMTLLMACAPSAAQVPQKEVFGRIVRVTDGDSVTLLSSDNTRITIRLAGIDAPESRMSYGHAAQAHLAGLLLNKEVVAVTHKQDRYRRTVATLLMGSKDINLIMVQAGMAWHYKRYAHEQPRNQAANYAEAELVARTESRGLWQHEKPMPPWLWRKYRMSPDKPDKNHSWGFTFQHGRISKT